MSLIRYWQWARFVLVVVCIGVILALAIVLSGLWTAVCFLIAVCNRDKPKKRQPALPQTIPAL